MLLFDVAPISQQYHLSDSMHRNICSFRLYLQIGFHAPTNLPFAPRPNRYDSLATAPEHFYFESHSLNL